MKKLIVLFVSSFLFAASLFSQPCDVSVDSLKGKYTGGCKHDKAEGEGTAIGIDSYTGSFRNGYPEGQGKYTWRDGSFYEGSWKSGLFDGQGTLNKKRTINPDSTIILAGFWKKGKYLGSHEKPYLIRSTTNNINEVNVRKLNSSAHEITILVKNITAGASSLGYPHLPKSRLIDVQAVEGQFQQEVPDEISSEVSNKYIFRDITYPFYAIFSFETTGTNAVLHVEKVGVEFFENCNWYVQVGIDN